MTNLEKGTSTCTASLSDEKSWWPRPPIHHWEKLVIRSINVIPGMSSIAYMFLFSAFQRSRMALMMEGKEEIVVEGGSIISSMAELSPGGLEKYLQTFDLLQTNDTWWRTPDAKSSKILLDNQSAFALRLEIISKARRSIALTTWVFELSDTGKKLSNALIEAARAGVEVKVIVDGVTLSCLEEETKLLRTKKLGILDHLVANGVQVHSLEKWVNEGNSRYVIGTHRKFLIVDDCHLLIGGRNINDKYFTTDNFHYRDAEILLYGNFTSTTTFFHRLWQQGREWQSTRKAEANANSSNETASNDSESSLSHASVNEPHNDGVRSHRKRSAIIAVDSGLFTLTLDDNEDTPKNQVFELSKPHDSSPNLQQSCGSLPTESTRYEMNTTCFNQVAVIALDHEAGNIQNGRSGHDITLSTLLYIIETAETKIDLVMGYFQLFPPLHDVLKNAVARGVRIRLLTNSAATHGLPSQSKVFGDTIEKLLNLGVEIFVPKQEYEGKFTLHTKLVVVDDKAALIGSWNCIGTSIFFDADFSVVLFSQENEKNSMFDSVSTMFNDDSYTRLDSIPKGSYDIPFIYKLLAGKYGRLVMERGY